MGFFHHQQRRRLSFRKQNWFIVFLSFLGKTIFLSFFVVSFVAFMYLYGLIKDTPEIDMAKLKNYEQVSFVYDSEGNEIAMLRGNENRIYAKYNEIPLKVVEAFCAIEDKKFRTHNGVDPSGIFNAVYGELTTEGQGRGGSTITQQLVKNAFLSSERSYKRKAQEMFMSIQLEKNLTKPQIMEYYLNEIYMGQDNYGVRAASLDYFGKELDFLSIKQVAAIAGITASPNAYNPKSDLEACNKRANVVVQEMYEDGYISKDERDEAFKEELIVSEEDYFKGGIYKYTAFVDFVVKELATDFLTAKGEEVTEQSLADSEYAVRTGGYRIYTTLDSEMQDEVQKTASEFRFNSEKSQCSAVFIDHHSGEVKVMIPGRNENDVLAGFNRATDSLQPIGSAAKPIFVYAPYIEAGANTDTIVDDTKTRIPGYNTDQGYPNGETTDSKITLRYAIETSRNVAAVKTLMSAVSIPTSLEYMEKEGVDRSHCSESPNGIALGADGYSTLEIAGAYATLANDGVYITPHGYTKVTDIDGKTIIKAENHIRKERVFSSETAYMITDILRTTVESGYSTGAKALGITCGNKTGTHEHKVVTSGGYTNYYTGFVRISRDDYIDITETSLNHAVNLWTQMMKVLHKGLLDRPIQDAKIEDLKVYQAGGQIRHKQG